MEAHDKRLVLSHLVGQVLMALGTFERHTTHEHDVDGRGRTILDATFVNLADGKHVRVAAVLNFKDEQNAVLSIAVSDILSRVLECRRYREGPRGWIILT